MIRKATVEDAEVMDKINRKVLPENYPLDFWIEYIGSPYSSTFIVEVKNENDESVAVGYILAGLEHNKQNRVIGHVYSIGILPEHRGKGYGRLLLENIETDLRMHYNIPAITLHVRKTNKGAIKFYNKSDYFRAKKIKEYYGKKTDGFLMKKTL